MNVFYFIEPSFHEYVLNSGHFHYFEDSEKPFMLQTGQRYSILNEIYLLPFKFVYAGIQVSVQPRYGIIEREDSFVTLKRFGMFFKWSGSSTLFAYQFAKIVDPELFTMVKKNVHIYEYTNEEVQNILIRLRKLDIMIKNNCTIMVELHRQLEEYMLNPYHKNAYLYLETRCNFRTRLQRIL